MLPYRSERAPWGSFPPAIRNSYIDSLAALPDYPAAKAGEAPAAFRLVQRLLKPETIAAVAACFRPTPDTRIVPVHAEEQGGRNKIPLMLAHLLADGLGSNPVETGIVQSSRAHRTGSNANHRLAFPPAFDGAVQPGCCYILVDDTLTQGGTLAALRGHIENRGGRVLGVVVMSAKHYSLPLAPTPQTLAALHAKHGDALNTYWKQEFHYELDRLTQSEAAHLCAAADLDTIRNRIAQARLAAGVGVGAGGDTETEKYRHILTLLRQENPDAVLKSEKPAAPCRGRVVFADSDIIVQHVADGSRYYQIHEKSALARVPAVGEKANISYAAHEKRARVRVIKA